VAEYIAYCPELFENGGVGGKNGELCVCLTPLSELEPGRELFEFSSWYSLSSDNRWSGGERVRCDIDMIDGGGGG